MAIADGKVSLKHLVTMETLTNEEVLGLIRRGGDFKNGRADFQLDRQYFAANLFLKIQHEHTSPSKWLRKTWLGCD